MRGKHEVDAAARALAIHEYWDKPLFLTNVRDSKASTRKHLRETRFWRGMPLPGAFPNRGG